MPLTLVENEVLYIVNKICGNDKQKHYIESLGFVEGATVQVLSRFSNYFVVLIKGSKIGMDKEIARHIIVVAE